MFSSIHVYKNSVAGIWSLHVACHPTMTLMSWHLIVTFCSLHVAQWLQLFEHKPFDSRTVMGFDILNGISIGLLNLCRVSTLLVSITYSVPSFE
jgi:hypothetical protein